MNKSPVKATAITMVNIQIVDFFILSEQVINLYYVNNRNLLKFRDWRFMILTRIERYRLTFKCKINIKFLQSKKYRVISRKRNLRNLAERHDGGGEVSTMSPVKVKNISLINSGLGFRIKFI